MSSSEKLGPRYKVQLRIDGESVPLKAFIHDLLGGAVVGMLESLKDCDDLSSVDLHIEKRGRSTDHSPARDD